MKEIAVKRFGLGGMLILTLTMWAGTAGAATVPHYTDGTSHDGAIDHGPPPIAPRWKTDCDVLYVDPVSYVWVTEHFDFDGDGTEDAALVMPYQHDPGFQMPVDVKELVAGKSGVTWTTWNIGTGRTDTFAFDCTIPEPTTTTSTTVSNTVVPSVPDSTTTTIAVVPAGAELPMTGSSGWLFGVGMSVLAAGVLLRRAGRST